MGHGAGQGCCRLGIEGHSNWSAGERHLEAMLLGQGPGRLSLLGGEGKEAGSSCEGWWEEPGQWLLLAGSPPCLANRSWRVGVWVQGHLGQRVRDHPACWTTSG